MAGPGTLAGRPGLHGEGCWLPDNAGMLDVGTAAIDPMGDLAKAINQGRRFSRSLGTWGTAYGQCRRIDHI
jgi:hypothetical protein